MTTKAEIEYMNDSELEEFLGERMCADPFCYNYSEDGVIYCIRHLHGDPRRADDIDILAKKRLRAFTGR